MSVAANEAKPPVLESAAVHLLLVSAVIFAVYPLAWVVALALSPAGMSGTGGAIPLPHEASLSNFHEVIGTGSNHPWLFWRQLANSLAVSLLTAASAVIIATPAAYALARFEFVGKKSGVGALLATQMFPTVASAVPLYIILESLQLLDSRRRASSSSTHPPPCRSRSSSSADPSSAIPVDIEEAAMVDGATRAQAFFKVVLPAARPAMAVTALFAFMSAWNEFILAATLLSKEEAFTLPVVLQRYVGEHGAAWGPFAAGAILVSVPVMALFYLAQRQLVSGLTAGGVKGLKTWPAHRAPATVRAWRDDPSSLRHQPRRGAQHRRPRPLARAARGAKASGVPAMIGGSSRPGRRAAAWAVAAAPVTRARTDGTAGAADANGSTFCAAP